MHASPGSSSGSITSKSNTAVSAVARKEGAFVVLRSKDLTVVHEARDSKHPINAVAWSPDGEY
jgi:hypothetical protein